MKLYTYQGETPDEALRKARGVHGDDSMIISTKEIRKKSLTEKGLYEVVIAAEDKVEVAPPNSVKQKLEQIAQKQYDKKKHESKITLESDGDLSERARQISKLITSPSNPYNIQPQVPSKPQEQNSEDIKAIKKEVEQMSDRIKLIQSMFWEEKNQPSKEMKIPQEFAEIYNLAKNSGIDKERLDALMELSLELMPLSMRSNSETIKRYFREVLRKMFECRDEHLSGKNIIMFVGPTGVGKTTTLAKIAARYSLMLKKSQKF